MHGLGRHRRSMDGFAQRTAVVEPVWPGASSGCHRADEANHSGDRERYDVAFITLLPDLAALDQRAKGFREQIAAKYGALDIVVEKVADGDATTGRDVMLEIIASYPELRGVFVSNPIMAKGAAEALVEHKTNKTGDKINLVGFGSDDQLVKFLQDGTIAALVVQDPFRMGYEGVKIALAASKGEQVPASVDTSGTRLNKAHMDSARSQELLKPQI